MKFRSVGAPAVFVVTLAIFLASPVRTPTDSRYSTLVSEALLRHRSFALDPWFPDRSSLPYQVEQLGGHVYSLYPPGGPVLVTPLIGFLRLLGLSSVGRHGRYDEESYDEGNDVIVQAVLAAVLMALLATIFFKTASVILPLRWSWIVALGAALGTQIWSTASRALWGDTFLVLILGAVVWLLVLHETGRRPLFAPLLATLLAWAYFSRPTASIDIVAVTLYLALRHRRLLVAYVATGAIWLGAFVTWSWLTFGTLLPTYYRIRTFGVGGFGSGLLGILFSPSRGQLVLVPTSLFVAYLVVRYARSLPLLALRFPALVAIVGHVVLIAAFPLWQGGHCYGPRYLTSLVPWLVLLATIGLRALLDRRAPGMRLELAAGAVLLAFSLVVHERGACARETWTWNARPEDINLDPGRVWSLREAQPLSGLVRAPLPSVIPVCVVGARVDAGAKEAEPYLVSGWSGSEGTFRWTDGRAAEMAFRTDSVEPLILDMELEGFLPPGRVNEQRMEIELNGRALKAARVDRPGMTKIVVTLPGIALSPVNRLRFRFPDAAFAAPFGLGKDPRQLAIAVHWFRFRRPD